MREQWRYVPGTENLYSVSSLGRVRSEDRVTLTCNGPRTYRGRILKPGADRNGYLQFQACLGGVRRPMYVALAVLTAFKGPCPTGLECCHGDGDKENNRLKNLRWDTRKNNHADKVAHGTTNRGERSGTAKLKTEDVLRIRSDVRQHKTIATELGVSSSLVYRIKKRIAWKHV